MQVAVPTKWRVGFAVGLTLVVILLGIMLIDTRPPNSATHGAMHMMKRRVLRFAAANGSLPSSVDQLPHIKGFDNSVVDGWSRPILWTINGDEVRFTSFGRDGMPGGTGEDADMIAIFKAKGDDGRWADEFCEWQVDPYGRVVGK